MALLIDTSVFIAIERQHRGEKALAPLAPAAGDEPVALAAITASDLLVGMHRADTEERRLRRAAFVEAVLSAVPVLPFDLHAARIHAGLLSQLNHRR